MYDLTRPQKLIYDMEKFVGGSIAVVCGSMLMEGEKSVPDLKAVANELYRLNDALRLRFSESAGQPLQYINEYAIRDFEVLHFADKTALDAYAESYARMPLNLNGELCEMKIVLIPGRYGAIVKAHHLVSDAWTFALLGTQFNEILNGKTPAACSYTDYIEKEKLYLGGRRYVKDRKWFLERFAKCGEATFLSERQSRSLRADRKTFVLGWEKAEQIKKYAEARGMSAFMLFISALAVYISRTKMNAERFYLGTAVLNRTDPAERNTAGMFVNTVPVLIEFQSERSFSENLEEIETALLGVLRHRRFNYGDVLKELRERHGLTGKLYDVLVSYQNASVGDWKIESTWYPCGMQTESLQIHIDARFAGFSKDFLLF